MPCYMQTPCPKPSLESAIQARHSRSVTPPATAPLSTEGAMCALVRILGSLVKWRLISSWIHRQDPPPEVQFFGCMGTMRNRLLHQRRLKRARDEQVAYVVARSAG